MQGSTFSRWTPTEDARVVHTSLLCVPTARATRARRRNSPKEHRTSYVAGYRYVGVLAGVTVPNVPAEQRHQQIDSYLALRAKKARWTAQIGIEAGEGMSGSEAGAVIGTGWNLLPTALHTATIEAGAGDATAAGTAADDAVAGAEAGRGTEDKGDVCLRVHATRNEREREGQAANPSSQQNETGRLCEKRRCDGTTEQREREREALGIQGSLSLLLLLSADPLSTLPWLRWRGTSVHQLNSLDDAVPAAPFPFRPAAGCKNTKKKYK